MWRRLTILGYFSVHLWLVGSAMPNKPKEPDGLITQQQAFSALVLESFIFLVFALKFTTKKRV